MTFDWDQSDRLTLRYAVTTTESRSFQWIVARCASVLDSINGAKERAPAAAMALIDRVGRP